MLNRREALALSGSALALSACATPSAQPAISEDARLDVMLTRHLEASLDRAPESVTNLGLDVGARAGQRAQLNDRSAEGVVARGALTLAQAAELKTINPARLSPEARLSYDIAQFQLESGAGYARRFPYHTFDSWRLTPYAVSQIGGAYVTVPDFLDSQHPIATREDAEAYLARLNAFAGALDGDTERTRLNAERGAIAPDFVLDKGIVQLRALADGNAADKAVVRSVARRAAEKGLGDYGPRAQAVFEGPVRAAIGRQVALLQSLRRRADSTAGVHKIPNGAAYYAHNLRAYTTTNYTPAEVHQIGLDQVRDLQARIDTLLRAQGYTKGTVGERINALNKEPRFLWPNTDAGRADLLSSLNGQIADLRPRLPTIFSRMPKTPMEVRRIPPATEDGAPGGYAQAGSLDGSRPGVYYINLKDTADWPKWSLPTLTAHEAVPGHLFQGALARESGELPLYRKLSGNSAYSEGWALYAERLADELGIYDDDPFGRIGYLQAYLFRAVRLVVDTGLHDKRWSRDQAVRYMVDNAAEPEGRALREIERYCVAPGQACAYKLGQTVIANLRDEAEKRPGFDIKRFHDAVLLGGGMPLTVLERRVRAAMAV